MQLKGPTLVNRLQGKKKKKKQHCASAEAEEYLPFRSTALKTSNLHQQPFGDRLIST